MFSFVTLLFFLFCFQPLNSLLFTLHHTSNNFHCFISLYCLFIRAIFKLYICIPTNCTQLIYFINDTLKHMYCLKLLKISPTCFGHLTTILREIQYLSLLQLLNYRCSSMPAAMCVLGPVLSCDNNHSRHAAASIV